MRGIHASPHLWQQDASPHIYQNRTVGVCAGQVDIAQSGNSVLGQQSLQFQPWAGNQQGPGPVAGAATITLPQQPYNTAPYDTTTGKRWCQATNTNSTTDPGAILPIGRMRVIKGVRSM